MAIVSIVEAMIKEASRNGRPTVSLETASWWFDKSSWLLALSLGIGFICTVLVVVMGTIKEHHWDLLRERANEKVAELAVEAATANQKAAEANKATEILREKNILLERAFSPRIVLDQGDLIEILKKEFPAQKVVIEAVQDSEARRMAAQIAFVVENAGWTRYLDAIPPIDVFSDGINIEYFADMTASMLPSHPETKSIGELDGFIKQQLEKRHPLSEKVAQRLSSLLAKTGIQAYPRLVRNIPPNMLRIVVGLKPIDPLITETAENATSSKSKVFGNRSEGRTFR